LPQALANLGVKFLNDAVSRMDQRVGDGCTLTAILLDEILREGWRRLSAGVSVQELTDGINLSSETVVAELEGHLLPVSEGDLTTALTRAAQLNENLASCLRQALEHVGVDGVILIKESKRVDSTVDLIEGLRFPKGYASPLFAADEESGEIRLRQA